MTFPDSGVRTELTMTTRTGIAAFTFPSGANAQVLVKGGASLAGKSAAGLRITGDRAVSGSATSGNFCGKGNRYTAYYDITFDRPFTAHGTWDGNTIQAGSDQVDSPQAGAYLAFGDTGTVQAKVSMSYVDVDGAGRTWRPRCRAGTSARSASPRGTHGAPRSAGFAWQARIPRSSRRSTPRCTTA